MVAGTAPEEVVGVVPDDARIPEVASLDTLSLQEIPCTNCAIHRSGSADLRVQSPWELPEVVWPDVLLAIHTCL